MASFFPLGWIRDPGLGHALHLLITQLADFYHTDRGRPVVLFPSKLESKGGVAEIPNFEAGSNWHLDPGGGRGSICGSVFTLARITGLQPSQPSSWFSSTPFGFRPTGLAEQGPGDIPHHLTFVLAVSNTSTIRCPVAQDINCWGVGVGWEFTRSAHGSDSEHRILPTVCQEALTQKDEHHSGVLTQNGSASRGNVWDKCNEHCELWKEKNFGK